VLDLQALLNDRRIIAASIIEPRADGSIAVDGLAVQRPYVFIAIGDPATLETALLRPGGLLTVFSNSRQGLVVSVQQRDYLIAPAHATGQAFQYTIPAK
jgi:uncharacterized protein YlxW (UPF0749 family)